MMKARKSPMASDSLLDLLARVPGWETQTLGAVAPLEGGLTNASYLFTLGGETYKLRVSGSNTVRLGINRMAERAALSVAQSANLAPPFVHFFDEGHFVARFVPGDVWDKDDLRRPPIREAVCRALRRVHALEIPFVFNPFADVRRRLDYARASEIALPPDTNDFQRLADDLETRLWRVPGSDTGLCHGDVFDGNILGTANGVLFLDWEYGGMGDVFYDLACLCAAYPAKDYPAVLADYWGVSPTPEQQAKLTAFRWLTWLWNWTWALLQTHEPDATDEHRQEEAALLKALRSRSPFP